MAKRRLLILAGGRSGEHEVSISSARSVLKALEGGSITAKIVVIAKDGRWLSTDESIAALDAGAAERGSELALYRANVAQQYDVVFPLLHGPFGEDGTIQGMLEIGDVPYIGSGVLSSAVCMDKGMSKAVLASHKIPQVRSCLVTKHIYDANPDTALATALGLNAPWFVKPANLGSSVGISRATHRGELHKAVELALSFDRRVIVEEGIVGAREVEIGVIGNETTKTSPVGEITFEGDFYDYDTKYTEGRAQLHIPADIPENVASRIAEIARKAYGILDCSGFARCDFFYQQRSGEILLNEINTIPGFTPTSMFTKLWQHAGMSYPEVIERLVELALERRSSTA